MSNEACVVVYLLGLVFVATAASFLYGLEWGGAMAFGVGLIVLALLGYLETT